MINSRKVAIIIPALNEATTVARIVTGVNSLGGDVFVVDDGSVDGTAQEAAAAGATVLKMPFPSGAWGAIQAGMLYALNRDRYEVFLTMDADGQHDPRCISDIFEAFSASDANVVIGSYPDRGSAARKTAWRIFSLLTRMRIHDLTSGLRLYDRRAVEILLTQEAVLLDYQDIGVLLLLRRNSMRCIEVPVLMCDRVSGCSRVFDSWFSVVLYLIKTCTWIITDWVASTCKNSRDKADYDVYQ